MIEAIKKVCYDENTNWQKLRRSIMKKKTLLALLSGMMSVTMLAGCSNGGKTQNAQTASPTSLPVIRIPYTVMGGNNGDEKLVEDALNKIMETKAKAKVDLVPIDFGQLSTQLNLMLSGGSNSIDLFNSFWYTSESNLVANGQVKDLSDLIKSDGQGILKAYSGLEDYLNCGKINGKLYGIPSIYAWSNQNIYMAKKDTSKAANIDWTKVKDLDTLTDAMLQMKKASPSKYFIPGSTDPYWVPKYIDYLGDTKFLGVLTDPTKSTKVENYYESDTFTNFLNHVKVWKKNNLISPDPLSNSEPTLVNVMHGVADGTPGYNWDTQIGIASTSSSMGLDMTGASIGESLATTGEVTTYMWHMSSFTKEPQAAMRVLNVLYTDPDAAQIVANGIEGKEYTLDSNGQMHYPEGKNLSTIGWPAASMAYWPNVTLCKTWSTEPKDIYSKMANQLKTVNKSLALGFQFDSTSVADKMTACSNVVAQYYVPLMTGEVDIDSTLPKFQKALKDAGIDQIIASKQKQLDDWLAQKKK